MSAGTAAAAAACAAMVALAGTAAGVHRAREAPRGVAARTETRIERMQRRVEGRLDRLERRIEARAARLKERVAALHSNVRRLHEEVRALAAAPAGERVTPGAGQGHDGTGAADGRQSGEPNRNAAAGAAGTEEPEGR